MERGRAGNTLISLLVLIGVVFGVGYFNYQRNRAIDEAAAKQRPYGGLSDQELTDLIRAYQEQVEADRAAYQSASSRRTEVQDQNFMDQKLREFDRVQDLRRDAREKLDIAATNQTALKELQAERAQRSQVGDDWMEILRLATRF